MSHHFGLIAIVLSYRASSIEFPYYLQQSFGSIFLIFLDMVMNWKCGNSLPVIIIIYKLDITILVDMETQSGAALPFQLFHDQWLVDHSLFCCDFSSPYTVIFASRVPASIIIISIPSPIIHRIRHLTSCQLDLKVIPWSNLQELIPSLIKFPQ